MTAPTKEQLAQCPRCLKITSGIHTCTPTKAWLKLEAENAELKSNLVDADTVYKNLYSNYVDLQKVLTDTKSENAALKAEVAHWKSNHATEVRRARVLKERTDMPIERVDAYEQWGKDQQQLAASQAREQQLRSGIEAIQDYAQECIDRRVLEYGEDFRPDRLKMMREDLALAQQALSQPSDTAALEVLIQKAVEVMRERCAGRASEINPIYGAAYVIQEIRTLPAVTMDDLKGKES